MSEARSHLRRSCPPSKSWSARPAKRTSSWHTTPKAAQSTPRLARGTKSLVRSMRRTTAANTATKKSISIICKQSLNQIVSKSQADKQTNRKPSTQSAPPTTPAAPPTRRIWSTSRTRGCSSTKTPPSAQGQPAAPPITKVLAQAQVSAAHPRVSWSAVAKELRCRWVFKIKMSIILSMQQGGPLILQAQTGIPIWIREIWEALATAPRSISPCRRLRR